MVLRGSIRSVGGCREFDDEGGAFGGLCGFVVELSTKGAYEGAGDAEAEAGGAGVGLEGAEEELGVGDALAVVDDGDAEVAGVFGDAEGEGGVGVLLERAGAVAND
jgi:hypothetical protein